MIAALVVFIYLALVLYVGIFAFRKQGAGKEDFFLANRSLGTFVFLLSLFGSNMTSFAILGSSGLAFRSGIGVYGLMASISGIVIPVSIFFIGTRLWAIGKRFGHITQVQILRDRFEMGHIGTLLFVLQAVMLVPYIIIGVMGGGETLEGVSGGVVSYEIGGLVVALVVMSYVFFGGMRGTAWVNALQTLMFLTFGTIAMVVVAKGMGGLDKIVADMSKTLEVAATRPAATNPATPPPVFSADGALLTRERISFWYYLSYSLIPLSSIMFPHIAIFCLTAKKLSSFKRTIILYPICIMALWAPAVYLGAIASGQPKIVTALAARSAEVASWIEHKGDIKAAGLDGPGQFALGGALASSTNPVAVALMADIRAGKLDANKLEDVARVEKDLREIYPRGGPALRPLANNNSDGVMLYLLTIFAPAWLSGILGAAIMACVMASDSQILALSTMFSEDVFAFYGQKEKWGEKAQIWSARIFVVALTIVAYVIAVAVHKNQSIFNIAIQYAFSGYASLAPIMLGALFWKRATKWGVLACTLWIAFCLIGQAWIEAGFITPPPPAWGPSQPYWSIGSWHVLVREARGIRFTDAGMLPVVPMFFGAAFLMVVGSLLTPPPSRQTVEKYFPPQ